MREILSEHFLEAEVSPQKESSAEMYVVSAGDDLITGEAFKWSSRNSLKKHPKTDCKKNGRKRLSPALFHRRIYRLSGNKRRRERIA